MASPEQAEAFRSSAVAVSNNSFDGLLKVGLSNAVSDALRRSVVEGIDYRYRVV